MKRIIFQVVFLLVSGFWLNAQTLNEMVVETTIESGNRVIRSCGTTELGILVFKTAIKDLNFKLNMQEKLHNQSYNSERNEYILCVEPTDRQYWVTILGAGYESLNLEIQEINANDPRYFRIISKQPPEISAASKDLELSQANATPSLSVLPAALSFASMGEQYVLEISSNRNWTVNNIPEWLTVEPLSGSNNGTVTLTAVANTGASTRSAIIAVRGSGVRVQNINIAQSTPILDEIYENMVLVEGGTFSRGVANDWLGPEDQIPVHSVTVSDFYIGMYEVTQAQWRAVMRTTVQQQRDKGNGGFTSDIRGEGDNYPMYFVSWNEVQEFIRKLNELTGKLFRLPTEAEWEFAARGGNKSNIYTYSGSNDLKEVAWFADNSGNKSHPVGTKSPNELGIFDMSGNVWEWCGDWYGSYSNGSKVNPKGSSTGVYRVIRGGCYGSFLPYGGGSSSELDWKYRNSWPPDQRINATGFRLVYDAE